MRPSSERLQFLVLPAAGRREIASERSENEQEDSFMLHSVYLEQLKQSSVIQYKTYLTAKNHPA